MLLFFENKDASRVFIVKFVFFVLELLIAVLLVFDAFFVLDLAVLVERFDSNDLAFLVILSSSSAPKLIVLD